MATPRPVVWPPRDVREATDRWVRKLADEQGVALPPTFSGVRIGPWSPRGAEPSDRLVGVWWHPDPERRPVTVEHATPEQVRGLVARARDSLEHMYGEDRRGGARAWLEPLLDGVVAAVGVDFYTGDAGGPGDVVATAFALAVAESAGGVLCIHDCWYELAGGLQLRASWD